MGELSNIDEEGFASAAFHSFPDKLAFDPYSGDYGSGFWGHAMNTATYLVNDPELGWIAFGGNVEKKSETIAVTPADSFRSRIYISPLGLWLTLDAGKFKRAVFDPKTGSLRLTLESAEEFTPNARLRIEQPAKLPGVGTYHLDGTFKQERGAYVIPLNSAATEVILNSAH